MYNVYNDNPRSATALKKEIPQKSGLLHETNVAKSLAIYLAECKFSYWVQNNKKNSRYFQIKTLKTNFHYLPTFDTNMDVSWMYHTIVHNW